MDEKKEGKKSQQEIDDILNSALDELEDDFVEEELNTAANLVAKVSSENVDGQASNGSVWKDLFSKVEDPEMIKKVEDAFNELKFSTETTSEKDGSIDDGNTDIDEAIRKTIEAMCTIGAAEEYSGASDTVDDDDILKRMMDEFEKLGDKEDANDVMEDMLKQLLSPELMYDPLCQICEKYPEWLAKNRGKMSEEDYNKFGAQYQCMQRVIHVYDTDPTNHQRLMELMQDMQQCGQVPQDIVEDLAPGLTFNGDGIPMMPDDSQSCCVQ